MATRRERVATEANRREHAERATSAGHQLAWRLGENANRRGHVYFVIGECEHCAAVVTVAADHSSSRGVRDARRVACSGPGTTILTEIENARASELIASATARYLTEIEVRRGA